MALFARGAREDGEATTKQATVEVALELLADGWKGKSGTGKSHILQAIGLKACEPQMSVRYARCVDLLDDLYAGLADGSYPTRLKRWSAPDLLIIDDVGLGQVKKRDCGAHALQPDRPAPRHVLHRR